ncbi:hypothetical protein D3C85_90310 [compost metagenome]
MQLVGIAQSEVLEELQLQVLLLILRGNLVLVSNLTVNPTQDRIEGLQLSLEPSCILFAFSRIVNFVFGFIPSVVLHLKLEDVRNFRVDLSIAGLIYRRTFVVVIGSHVLQFLLKVCR